MTQRSIERAGWLSEEKEFMRAILGSHRPREYPPKGGFDQTLLSPRGPRSTSPDRPCARAVAQARELGATVTTAAIDMAVGRFAGLMDPQGGSFTRHADGAGPRPSRAGRLDR